MEPIINFLQSNGFFGLISLILLLIVFGGIVYITLRLIVSKAQFKFKDIELNGNKFSKDIQNNNKTDKKDHNPNITITATQDYKIIYLIITVHANRITNEMIEYCKKNGLNKISNEDYDIYVDEKKNIYITELRDMITREYVSYDLISIQDLYEFINIIKDSITSRVDKLYRTLRDISIEQHRELNKKRIDIFSDCISTLNKWKSLTFTSETEALDELVKIINDYKIQHEKIVVKERIDILDLQKQKIEAGRKTLVDEILHRLIEFIGNKTENK